MGDLVRLGSGGPRKLGQTVFTQSGRRLVEAKPRRAGNGYWIVLAILPPLVFAVVYFAWPGSVDQSLPSHFTVAPAKAGA